MEWQLMAQSCRATKRLPMAVFDPTRTNGRAAKGYPATSPRVESPRFCFWHLTFERLFDGSWPEQNCQHSCPYNAPAYPRDIWMGCLPLQNAFVKVHYHVSDKGWMNTNSEGRQGGATRRPSSRSFARETHKRDLDNFVSR